MISSVVFKITRREDFECSQYKVMTKVWGDCYFSYSDLIITHCTHVEMSQCTWYLYQLKIKIYLKIPTSLLCFSLPHIAVSLSRRTLWINYLFSLSPISYLTLSPTISCEHFKYMGRLTHFKVSAYNLDSTINILLDCFGTHLIIHSLSLHPLINTSYVLDTF